MIFAIPTRGGMIFVLLTAAAVGTAIMNVGLMTALLASVLIGILGSSFLSAQFSLYRISVERITAADVPANSKAVLPLRVINTSIFYRQPIVIREEFDFLLRPRFHDIVPPLAPGERRRVNRKLIAEKRGHFSLDKITLISGDSFGFFRKSRSFSLPGEITVSPRIEELEKLPIQLPRRCSDGGEGRALGRAGAGGDFFDVRPYRPGDEMRHIYWRGSAARNQLLVKEFEASVTERIHIFLDSCAADAGQDETDSNFEHLVSAAASICTTLSKWYCNLCFITEFSNTDRIYLNGDAAGLHNKIIEALTVLQPGSRRLETILSDQSEHIGPGDTVFLLTMSCSPELLEIMHYLTDAGIKINWIYAPAVNFPPVEPDIMRELPAGKPVLPADLPAEPAILDFETGLNGVLKCDNGLEKV